MLDDCVLWFIAGAATWATIGEWAIRALARSIVAYRRLYR